MMKANPNQISITDTSCSLSRKNSSNSHTSASSLSKNSRLSVHPSPTAEIRFPWKLHRILDDADLKGFNDVISWVPTENGFKVHKPKEFDERIMPKYFDKTKYKSFQRQLNMWGFDRVGQGPLKGAYLHSCFIRGEPHLCERMIRIKIKGPRSKKLRKGQDSMGGCSNHSTLSHVDPLGRGSNHSTSSSASISDIEIQDHIKRAAEKVADLEQQKAEIQRKLEMLTRSQQQLCEDDDFQPLPLDAGDSLLVGGHNFFYNEDGKFSDRSRRRTGRRFSLELSDLMPTPLAPSGFDLVTPNRRFSLLGTPVHNPYEKQFEQPPRSSSSASNSTTFMNMNPQNANMNEMNINSMTNNMMNIHMDIHMDMKTVFT